MDVAARTNAGGEESDEGLGDEAALVMAGLAPGIGEVDVHAVEGVLGDHVAHDFNGVVADDAHIGEGHLVETLGKRADAGHEDLAAEEVDLGVGLRDGGGRLAHAAADFENERGVAAEGLVGVEKLGGVLDLVLQERLVKGALLGGRDVPRRMTKERMWRFLSASSSSGVNSGFSQFFSMVRSRGGPHGAAVDTKRSRSLRSGGILGIWSG